MTALYRPSRAMFLRLALVLAVVCGLSLAGWRVGVHSAAATLSRAAASAVKSESSVSATNATLLPISLGSITAFGTPLTENFDTLATSGTANAWTDNSTIPGAYMSGTSAITTYIAGNGSTSTAGVYSYGTGTNTDRALGSLNSNANPFTQIFYGFKLTNNTGSPIGALNVSYNGEQWRRALTAAQRLTFSYQVGSTGTITLTTGSWTPAGALDFTGPATTGSGAIDGNAAANRTAISGTIVFPTPVADGQEIWIRWTDVDNPLAQDHGLAIDDVSVTAFPVQYQTAAVALSGNTTVAPLEAPVGAISATATTTTDFKGKLEADAITGVVRVTNAHPAGNYPVTVRTFDALGSLTTTKTFPLAVTTPAGCTFYDASSFSTGNLSLADRPTAIAVGDFNGDGKQDFVTALEFGGIAVFLRNSSNNGFDKVEYPRDDAFYNSSSVAVGDFNGDGKQDIALGTRAGIVSVYLRNVLNTGFDPPVDSGLIGTIYAVAVADFNGDGKQDIATANYTENKVSVLLRKSDNTGFDPKVDLTVSANPRTLAVGDFNFDGRPDIVTGHDDVFNFTLLLRNTTNTGFNPSVTFSSITSSISAVTLDFNGDGKQDIASATDDNFQVYTFLRNSETIGASSSNGFSQGPGVLVSNDARDTVLSAAAGDFNNDGRQDIVATKTPFEGKTLAVLLNDNNAAFLIRVNHTAGARPKAVAVGDFNGDNRQDIVTANYDSNNVSVLQRVCNYAPTFLSISNQTRQKGSAAVNATIATVSDPETLAGNLTVTATTVPAGISVTNIVNTGGTIKADVAAGCSAATGDNTVVLTVSDGAQSITGNLTVTVTDNTAPTVGTYANQNVTAGSNVTVTPSAAPGDNGSIMSVSATASPNFFTGTFSGNTATGAVTITNAAPAGTYTITVTVTDNCGATVQKTFTLTINGPPAIDAVTGLSRVQGSTVLHTTIAYVFDNEGDDFSVTLTSANPSNGVTLSNLAVNLDGEVTADIAVTCTATNASFTLQASDGGSTSTATLNIAVTANTPPMLGYDPRAFINKTTADGLSGNTVNAIVVAGSKIFIGTGSSSSTGGLSISTDGGQTFTNKTTANGLGANTVSDISVNGNTVVVSHRHTGAFGYSISTDGGASFTYINGGSFFYSIFESGGTVYGGSNGVGLKITTDGGNSFTTRTTADGLGSDNIRDIYVTGSTVYAATTGGLSISTDGGASFTNRTTAQGLGNNFVEGVFVVGNTVYAATFGGLSTSIDGGATFTNKTTANGLGNNWVHKVFAAGSAVYAATDGGLSISTDGGATFVNKTTADGLGHNLTRAVAASGSMIYAGTDGGFAFGTGAAPGNPTVAFGGSTTINPTSGPNDNGTIATFAVQQKGSYTGTISVNSAGVVSISNAAPAGTHTITIRATDNCGAFTDATIMLTVNAPPNTAPTITATMGLMRQQGTAASNSQIATVNDTESGANGVTVTVTSANPSNGVTISNIVNNNGMVTANIVADCTAMNASFTLQASDGSLMSTATLNVTVTANSNPTVGTYSNQTVVPGAGFTVTPSTAPADNGSIMSVTATASPNTFTGSLSGNIATGAITINNANPPGVYTVTVTVKDNCGAMTTRTFTLKVNTAPTISPMSVTRQQGNAAANSQVATALDAEDAETALLVTVDGGATATTNGVTVSNLAVNASGQVTANVAASCTAINASFTLTVTDTLGGTANATLNVTVTANAQPTVGNYPNTVVAPGGSTMVTPTAAPADNGSIASVTATATPNNFSGTFSGNAATGALTITNAGPMGGYIITVTITDNCGASVTRTFMLTVSACGATLSKPDESFAGNGGSGSFTVTIDAGCPWTATSNAPGFITVTAPSGTVTGSGTVSYNVAQNPGASPRSNTISVAGQTFTVLQGRDFLEVPQTHPFYAFIGKLSARGITQGCGGGNFCPDDNVTREQMAIFIERALGVFTPPTPMQQTFQDVPPSALGYPFIEDFAARGITAGCAAGPPRLYCPTANVTREQVAIFMLRALGVFTPPAGPATPTFQDVPNSGATDYSHEFIEEFARRGISSGCAAGPPRLYCPTAPVTRAAMAVFLVRAFNL